MSGDSILLCLTRLKLALLEVRHFRFVSLRCDRPRFDVELSILDKFVTMCNPFGVL